MRSFSIGFLLAAHVLISYGYEDDKHRDQRDFEVADYSIFTLNNSCTT